MTRKALGLVLAISWIASFAQSAAANAGPPRSRSVQEEPREKVEINGNTVTVSLAVRNSTDGTTRLVIPRQFIVTESAEDDTDPLGTSDVPGRMRTLLAGLALSLAAVSIVLVRRKRSNLRIVAASVLLAVTCFAVGMATADITVPGRERKPRPRKLLPTVVIEYTDGGDVVELLRGKDFPK